MSDMASMPMSMPMPLPFTWGRITTFDISWITTALLVLVLILYLFGARRYPTCTSGSKWSRKRTLSFVAGIICVFLATQSVLGVYEMTLYTDHMIQHLLLVMIAAALFAMAAPLELACTTLPGAVGRGFKKAVDSKIGEFLGYPAVGFILYAIFIPLTHLTSLFNLMLSQMWVHHLVQFAFVMIGYLFWRPVVAIEPSRHPLSPGLRMIYLALAVPVDTFTGLALVMSDHELFSTYTSMHRTWGPSLLTDLKTGGAVMWIGGDFLMLLAIFPIAFFWMRDEDSKIDDLDARLDAERLAAGLPFTRHEMHPHD
jgi:putative copper resistance protein D